MAKQVLLYEQAVPVSSQKHRDLSVKTGNDYGFAREVNSVPLIAVEFPHATDEYAIVFAGTDDNIAPLAILGIQSNRNLFVSDTNEWKGDYIPAFVRRYPFVFAGSPDKTNFTLCIDESYGGCNTNGRGERLFDADGERTQYLNGTLGFLRDYEEQFERTRAFCRRLKDLDLLEPVQAQFTAPGGTTGALTGFMAINREKLQAIPSDKLVEMMKTGELELVYLHLFSLRNFRKMAEIPTEPTIAATDSPPDDETAPQGSERPRGKKAAGKKAKLN